LAAASEASSPDPGRETSTATRDPLIDVARGLGVLLVLYAHSLEPLFIRDDDEFVDSAFQQWRVMYSFHMPLFYFLSGAARVAARPGTGAPGGWYRPLREAFMLLLFVQVCQLGGGVLFALDMIRQGTADPLAILQSTLRGALLLCDLRLSILWYLVSLAVVILLAHLWNTGSRSGRAIVIVACAISLWAAWPVGPAWDVRDNWFQVRSWMPGLVFYALGRMFTGRYPKVWVGALALLALIVLAPLNRGCPTSPTGVCANIADVFAPWMILGRHGFLPFFYAFAILGIAVVLGLSRVLPRPLFAYFGRASFPLYVLNAIFLEFVLMKLTHMALPGDVGPWIYIGVFAGTVGLHVAAVWLLAKPINACRALCDRWASTLARRVAPGV
jgi:acyltransferase